MNESLPVPPAQTLPTETDLPRPYTSKIGRLPKATRDKLNFLILDGNPYDEILKIMGDALPGITENNISRWATGRHKEWLRERQPIEDIRFAQEVAMDLATQDGGSRIHEATLQLAVTKLSDMVRSLDCTDFKELLRDDPAKLIPFLNSLATISNAELRCERHRLDLDARTAGVAQAQTPRKGVGLKPETRQIMENDLNLM